jgi:hypothetical protein
LLLACGGAVVAAVTALWVSMDSGIGPPTDSAHHLALAQAYARALHLGGLEALWQTMRTTYVGWPPGAYLLIYGPLGWVLSDESHFMRLYGLVLVPLLLWGTYRIGADLASRRVGALAALLTIFSFGISGQLRQVSIDLPATTAVLLTMVALVRSRRLGRKNSLLLLGGACGVCLFTRVQSLFFLAGPLLLTAAAALWTAPGRRERARLLAGLGLALGVALAVSSPWWLGRLGLLWRVLTAHLDPTRIAPRGDPGFAAGLQHYLGATGKLNGWPVALAALATLPWLLARCRRPGGRMTEHLALLALVLGGILGASAGVHREPRYMLPAVPHVALLGALGLDALGRRLGELLAAGVLSLTVLPTLVMAATPVSAHSPLVRRGILEWGYVRKPLQTSIRAEARALTRAARATSVLGPHGGDAYLLLVQDKQVNHLPRLSSFVLPRFPDLAFGATLAEVMANTPWQRRARRRRRMFVLSEIDRRLKLPLVWKHDLRPGPGKRQIRLYRVPPGHRLHGPLGPRTLR